MTDHHALIPTINEKIGAIYQKLSEAERNIFDEVVRSLIAIFYPPYKYSASKLLVEIGDSLFQSSGKTIRSLGYKEVLHPVEKEKNDQEDMQLLPHLQEGEQIKVDNLKLLEKKTVAPKRYNVGNIIKVMEKYGIGTSATRAEILKKLEKRGYLVLEKGKYISTELGRKYIAIVPEELKSADLTRRFEERLEEINVGTLKREDFLEQIDDEIRRYMKLFGSEDGEKLVGKDSKPLGKCPVCGGDVIEGKKNYYCSAYRTGCQFFIMKVIAGKELPQLAIIQLLTSGITNSISGFKKKDGSGTFSAKLALDEENKVVFRFDKKRRRK